MGAAWVSGGWIMCQAQTIIPHNAAFQTKDLDTYDSKCDDLSTAQVILMANISNYGSEQEYEPTTAEEKQDRRNEIKARATLLMAHPNKDQLKFHSYQDAKLLMEAIEKSSETMDQTFYRLQKHISQLEIQGEVINQEDMNLKLLRSLPSEWKTHALIWRNKVEIKTISLDDLYNILKIYKPELIGSSSTSQNSQNVAFVSNSTNNTNNTNKADNNAHGVSTTYTQGLGYDAATAASLAVESFVNLTDKFGSDKGYPSVPPPLTGNFIPRKPDLTFMDEIVESENLDVTTIVTPSNDKKVVSNHKSAGVKLNGDAVKPKTVRENSFIPPIIKDWNFDDESEIDYTVRPNTEKIKFVKSARETVEK
ncbi:hypothetical protein Tco_1452833, partial [Tanacetum coccineum]